MLTDLEKAFKSREANEKLLQIKNLKVVFLRIGDIQEGLASWTFSEGDYVKTL
jgi:hypothetical protein